jgi:ribosomal protein S18 acetylase RimI-like enzyme
MRDDLPKRLPPGQDLHEVHKLLTAAFAFMEGRIDPPSSLGRLNPQGLAEQGEVWVIGMPPVACMVLTARPDTLYLGRLAVAEAARGQGLARALVEAALARARVLGRPHVTLQTRVELVENHATFRRLGFVEVARTAHPGFDRPTSITFRRCV